MLFTNCDSYRFHCPLFQPLYGFTSSDYIPFRNASGGGRDVHFLDDKELDLDEVVMKPLPKLPLEPSIKGDEIIQMFVDYLWIICVN